MKYKRILLKLSGEALMANDTHGINPERLLQYITDITEVYNMGIEIGLVIGGGNFFRGIESSTTGINKTQGDYMGMLATIMNGIALQSALDNKNIPAKLLSGLKIEPICEETGGRKAIDYLKNKNIVIFSGGTGNPYFTTDSTAALRAIEINADVVLKGTRVDGVYDSDPEKNPNANKYSELTFDEAYQKQLKIMDLTAFTLCKDNKLPIIVFDMNTPRNLKKLITGEKIGTIIK